LLGVLDRHDKDAITLLFAAVPKKRSIKVDQNNKEIEKANFQTSLPKKSFAIRQILLVGQERSSEEDS